MELKEKIESDFKEALKRQDKVTVSTLRMLKSAIHNKEIEQKGRIEDADVNKVIIKQMQQHQESIEQFTKGKRPELAEKETQELEILKKYIPAQLSPEETADVIKKIIVQAGAKDKSDFGKVMKLVMAELKGRADGKLVNKIVTELLSQNSK